MTIYNQMCLNKQCSLGFRTQKVELPDGDTENRNIACQECGEPTKREGQECTVGASTFNAKDPAEKKRILKKRSKMDTEKNWKEKIHEDDKRVKREGKHGTS